MACFALGLVLALNELKALSSIALLMGVGFFGSLSTFSTFAVELLNELRAGQPLTALVVALASIGQVCSPVPLVMGWEPMAENKPSLKLEFQELLLVGFGAVPGALLRWQLALHLGDQNLLVNVLGYLTLARLPGTAASVARWYWLLRVDHHQQLDAGGHEGPQLVIGLHWVDRANPQAGARCRSPGIQPGAMAQAASAASIADEVFWGDAALEAGITVRLAHQELLEVPLHITSGIHLIEGGVGLSRAPLACTFSNSSKSAP